MEFQELHFASNRRLMRLPDWIPSLDARRGSRRARRPGRAGLARGLPWIGGALCIVALGCRPDALPADHDVQLRSIEVVGEPTCPGCSVVLTEIAALSDLHGPAGIREDAATNDCMVGQLSTGEFVVTGLVGGGRVLRFDPQGTEAVTIGGPGQGPGEFSPDLRGLISPDDTIYVMDDGQARMQVLTPAGDFVRSFTTPARFRRVVLLDDGNLLFHRTPEAPDDPIFLVTGPSGEVVANFGRSILAGADAALDVWTATTSRSGGVWIASLWDYSIQHHDPPGEPTLRINRRVGWFPSEPPSVGDLRLDVQPPPTLRHLWEDDAGRLWVYLVVPHPEWRPDIPLDPRDEWARRSFQTVVEVIDPGAEEVIARGRFDGLFGDLCGTGLMYTVVEGADLDTRLVILQPELHGDP